jgi:gamma-glutamylcyclotransferase (GGCT)/AIG2-like uncharacterized protein YtfP
MAEQTRVSPTAIFVYGTLKRGQVREACWPTKPLHVVPAVVCAELYDLGPHPAMIPGSDRIAGELWQFVVEDMAETLAVLDEVEGFSDRAGDWYRRVVIDCETAIGKTPAWTYLYARLAELRPSQRIHPDAAGFSRWP